MKKKKLKERRGMKMKDRELTGNLLQVALSAPSATTAAATAAAAVVVTTTAVRHPLHHLHPRIRSSQSVIQQVTAWIK